MADTHPLGCTCSRCARSREAYKLAMIERAQVQAELVRAIEFWRWCWDCGVTKQDCEHYVREEGRKCCPDCRHRDATAARVAHLAPTEKRGDP